jgi:Mg2+/Co2+ transporter CorB
MVSYQSAIWFGIGNYKETLTAALPKYQDADKLIDTVLTIKDRKSREFILLTCYDLTKMSGKAEAFEFLYNIANEMGYDKEKLHKIIINTNYSRIPIYDGNFDNIIGVLHIKTYLSAYLRNPNISIKSKLQKPYFVSSNIMIDDLFNGFKKHHTHIAIVRDKNKKVIGMVTMDDVLEELVSDISEPSQVKGNK